MEHQASYGAAPDTHDLVPGTVIGARIVYRGKATPLPYVFDDEDRDDAIMALVENLLAEFKDLAGVSETYVDTTYRQPMLALVGRAARGRGTETDHPIRSGTPHAL